jgi:hypothetical protein
LIIFLIGIRHVVIVSRCLRLMFFGVARAIRRSDLMLTEDVIIASLKHKWP